MQRDKKYLESSAHAYVAASAKHKTSGTKANKRSKNLARMRLQNESLKFAADFLETLTGLLLDGGAKKKACAPGVKQLREWAADADRMMKELVK